MFALIDEAPEAGSSAQAMQFARRPSLTLDQEADLLSILQATRKYVEEVTPVFDFDVIFEGQEGDVARLKVAPRDQRTDAAICFVRRNDDTWEVVVFGTAFPPDFLTSRGIPEGLWPS